MKEKEKYVNFWRKNLAIIRIQLKNSKNGPRSLPISGIELTALGNRDSAGYQFNLEIKSGKVTNNISGSAVARDLYKVLTEDDVTKNLLKEGNYKLNLDTGFVLRIQKMA